MKTLIYVILDRSGSMGGREGDVVGGVNSFLAAQKEVEGEAKIAFVRFDTESTERFRALQDIKACDPLYRDDFQPRGGTPLLDAVGTTLREIETDVANETPQRVVVVIVTDGEENASRSFSKRQIRTAIEAKQESGLWSFIFLGADMDAFREATEIGILAQNAMSNVKSAEGYATAFAAVSDSVAITRATGSTTYSNLGGDMDEKGSIKKWKGSSKDSKSST